jgi:hypothetical protein
MLTPAPRRWFDAMQLADFWSLWAAYSFFYERDLSNVERNLKHMKLQLLLAEGEGLVVYNGVRILTEHTIYTEMHNTDTHTHTGTVADTDAKMYKHMVTHKYTHASNHETPSSNAQHLCTHQVPSVDTGQRFGLAHLDDLFVRIAVRQLGAVKDERVLIRFLQGRAVVIPPLLRPLPPQLTSNSQTQLNFNTQLN